MSPSFAVNFTLPPVTSSSVQYALNKNHIYFYVELKEILDALRYLLGCITIRVPRKHSDTQQNYFGILILTYLVIIFIFEAILIIQ